MSFSYISPEDLIKLVENNAPEKSVLIIDVRDYDHNLGGHFRFSVNIPSQQILMELPLVLEEINKYDQIITFCRYSKQRGPSCAQKIASLFPRKNVSCVSGGFCAIKSYYRKTDYIVDDDDE